jgi:signal transduction histidine kinase
VPGDGFVLIYADITERKRNEAEIRAARDAAEEASRTIEAAYRDLKAAQANLIQAEKMASLGQLTAGIAHEIKNSLNFVNNFAELSVDLLGELKEAITPAEATLKPDQRGEVDDVVATLTSNLEKITEHGKRADGIVKAMLEHSRGSSTERRMVDLNTLIEEALNLAYHGARAQDQSFNISLERDFAEGIAPIEVNPQGMTRVFLNLFSNGFYATTKRARDGANAQFVPTLKVITRDAGDAVEIRVWDNPPAFQPKSGTSSSSRSSPPSRPVRAPALVYRSATTSSHSSMAARSRSRARSANTASSQYARRASSKRRKANGQLPRSRRRGIGIKYGD